MLIILSRQLWFAVLLIVSFLDDPCMIVEAKLAEKMWPKKVWAGLAVIEASSGSATTLLTPAHSAS